MNAESILKQKLIAVVVIDRPEDAVPLAEALLAGGLHVLEVMFRTFAAGKSIERIRREVPQMIVGAGTLLTADQVRQAGDAGSQFGVSPGLSEAVAEAASEIKLPWFPGCVTPTEVMRALDLGWTRLKFFPAEACGGVNALRALVGPFGQAGVKFIPTGGITAALLPAYLALPEVAAIGGSWMAERKLIQEMAWEEITARTTAALQTLARTKS
jgi:2-dehydro-3-deoxyphosphogluconate aldolase / (4S)-4-hydroxy-2-oxoglutarate aldolase